MLYRRIVDTGTIAEPGGVPDPLFSLPSTINWMRGLAVLATHPGISFKSARVFYAGTTSLKFNRSHEENTILEQLFFALHQLAALEALRAVPRQADVARLGIVTWYYGIYYAASAMVAAQAASFQDDHIGTANSWDHHIAERGLAMPPFGLRLPTLVETDTKKRTVELRAGNTSGLKTKPGAESEAFGACCAYLSGTAAWYRWRTTLNLQRPNDFKALGVDDFRTKAARQLRDEHFSRKGVSFLHQAFRYRGKANYREALFLGYGPGTERLLTGYVDDLATVLGAFVSMAGAFASLRLGNDIWSEFVADVENKRAFSLSPLGLWR